MSVETGQKNTQREKQITIVFCITGYTFSVKFIQSWSEILVYCLRNNIKPILSTSNSKMYMDRNSCLKGDFRLGVEQKPFNGQIEYDYLMWIDSDKVFSPESLVRLLNHNKDVVSGMYLKDETPKYNVARKIDLEYYIKNSTFELLDREALEKWVKDNVIGTPRETENNGTKYLDLSGCTLPLMEVEYCELGWTLMKKGVIEQLDYPWFNSLPIDVINNDENGSKKLTIRDYCNENVALFTKFKEANIKCYVDVLTIVGHEKQIVL